MILKLYLPLAQTPRQVAIQVVQGMPASECLALNPSTQAFAAEFKKSHTSLYTLINNAVRHLPIPNPRPAPRP